MKYFIILLLLIVFSCKDDDCEPVVDNSNTYPKLVEATFFSFTDFSLEGTDCKPILIVSLDSFASDYLIFLLDSIPINISTSDNMNYKGILKIEDKFGTCFDPRLESNPNVKYQYVNILYWELY